MPAFASLITSSLVACAAASAGATARITSEAIVFMSIPLGSPATVTVMVVVAAENVVEAHRRPEIGEERRMVIVRVGRVERPAFVDRPGFARSLHRRGGRGRQQRLAR